MVKPTYYVTTPIYYVNSVPHLGSAYTTVAADVLARFKRQCGYDVFFLTGTDEHGQKVAKAAAEAGKDPKEWADEVVSQFYKAWDELLISNDDFIRTTDERHIAGAQAFLQKLYEAGDIYPDTYEGWYCVQCETFWTPTQLVDASLCPECRRETTFIKEENYFFRLSKYGEPLLEHIRKNPGFIQPNVRRNEIVSFIDQGLKDQSVSRTTLTWGIPLPWDPSHVMYVWVDALLNYITGIGYGRDAAKFEKYWPAQWHLIGKDILRFHCVIWPAMLLAAGLPLPEHVFAHGFLLAEGERMSKSKGNVIAPSDLIAKFGVDAYRYYFMREISFGQDGSVSMESMIARFNADLSNDFGNLVSRTIAMVVKYLDGVVPQPGPDDGLDLELKELAGALFSQTEARLDSLNYSEALSGIWEFVGRVNSYVDRSAPWDLAKEGALEERLRTVLYNCLESLRLIALLVWPFMPQACERLWAQLGIEEPLEAQRLPEALSWGGLAPGARVRKAEGLFPRIYE
ncbi:MAG: methionine--tRNA ligase [Actinobacteria bacterium]|nr:MAG: methionine--tRNA ligase [Actinomycetota bacterium]